MNSILPFKRIARLMAAAGAAFAQAAAAPRYSSTATLALRSAAPNRTEVPCHEIFELTLDLDATYDNPFSTEEIRVYALFTPPAGEPVEVDGFFYQAFTRRMSLFEHGKDIIEPAGEPVWKIRFTPTSPGEWRYRVFARDRVSSTELAEASFRALPPLRPGFVRRCAKNPAMFAHENGEPFVPIGLNLGWAGWWPGSRGYAQWLPALAAAGGNWARIWMCSWNLGLEWTPQPERAESGKWGERRISAFAGLGSYSLDNAWKLDELFELAERHRIHILLCLGTYGEFTEGGAFNEGQWRQNPYNAANGGPCAEPQEFWTKPEARRLYRQRLRYIASRYACYTALFGWEFWNETHAPADWVAEMAAFLKGTGKFNGRPADPYRHLLSTTYGNAEVWRLAELDFTMSHIYGEGDMPDHAPAIHADALQHAEFGKPHLVAEFGIDWRKSDEKYDPAGLGINLHNALWASLMSGNAGGAMIWYWDDYVHAKNLYAIFTPLRGFAASMPWNDGPWKPVNCEPARTDSPSPDAPQDLELAANTRWGKAPFAEFDIAPWGEADGKPLPSFLYAPTSDKAALRDILVFRVNYARPGRFLVCVHKVSSKTNKIRFLLDGAPALELALSPVPPADPQTKPEYKETELVREWNVYQAVFDKEYGIDVPAGAHTIELENTDGDWISISGIKLTNYTGARFPAVHLYGLSNGKQAVLWAHNARHNWKTAAAQTPVAPTTGASTAIRGMPDGQYSIAWQDSRTGAALYTARARCENQVLPVEIPKLASAAAARIIPENACPQNEAQQTKK